MTITLPPDLAAELDAAAKSRGTTPDVLLIAAARRIVIAAAEAAARPAPPPPAPGESLLDSFDGALRDVADFEPRRPTGEEMFAPKPPRDPRDTPEAALARALAMQAAAGIPPGESMYDALKDFIGQVEGDGQAWSQDCGRKFADDLAAGRKARP